MAATLSKAFPTSLGSGSSNITLASIFTRARILIAVSLAITWSIASLVPHYTPMIQAEFKSRISEARQKIPTIKLDWNYSTDPRLNYNQTKVALLIEPRPIPHLVPQILHMISVVPPDWRFLFIGSEKSVISVGRSYATKHQQVIGKMDLMVLPEPWQIDSKENVYRMLTDMRFYDEFLPGVEWILKYESDSIMCANSDESLNDWLDWSWAGAPRSADDRFAGNGGLSLRRVSAIRRVLSFQERYNDTEAEDEWFGKRLWVLPGEKVAAGTDGALAVEDTYFENSMGFHVRDGGQGLNDDVWKSQEQRKKIFAYCPELSMIMDMKLERERCDGDNGEGSFGKTDAEIEEEKQREDEEEERRKQKEEERRKKVEEERKKAAEDAKKKAEEQENGEENEDQHKEDEKEDEDTKDDENKKDEDKNEEEKEDKEKEEEEEEPESRAAARKKAEEDRLRKAMEEDDD